MNLWKTVAMGSCIRAETLMHIVSVFFAQQKSLKSFYFVCDLKGGHQLLNDQTFNVEKHFDKANPSEENQCNYCLANLEC